MEIEKARYVYRQKPRRRRRFTTGLMAVLFLLSLCGYSALALTKAVPAVAAEQIEVESNNTATITNLAWPDVGQAAIGTMNDGVLATKGAGQQRPIASMTKVITALMILEKSKLEPGRPGQTRTFDANDEAFYRTYLAKYGSVVPTDAGGQVTDLQAMHALLIVSANNIADSMVRWHFGSMEAYLAYANGLLKDWGLENTTVADASGFSPESVSTPSDMIALGRKLLGSPLLSGIVNQQELDWPGWGIIKNTNRLMSDEDAVGIKTGNTDEAGSCLLFAYRMGPDKKSVFIGVLMGQPNYPGMFVAARALKDSALQYFRTVEVLPAGTVVGNFTSVWGQATEIITTHAIKVYGWAGKHYSVDISFDPVSAPILKNQIVGRAFIADNTSATTSLSATSSLGEPGAVWRLANYW